MFHFGKTNVGELEILLSGADIGALYRAISAAGLIERRDVYEFKCYLEANFQDEIR